MNVEDKIDKIGKRVRTVEDAIVLLTALVDSHDDRLLYSMKEDENLNGKISALVDAQIKSEDILKSIRQKSFETDDKISILIEMQMKSISELNALHKKSSELDEKFVHLVKRFESL
jgi:hypothetical protein